MKGELADRVTDRLQHAESLYHRLVLLVGAGGTGKSKTLHDVAELHRCAAHQRQP